MLTRSAALGALGVGLSCSLGACGDAREGARDADTREVEDTPSDSMSEIAADADSVASESSAAVDPGTSEPAEAQTSPRSTRTNQLDWDNAVRIGFREDEERIELNSADTFYLPQLLVYGVVPEGWSGSGHDSNIELSSPSGGASLRGYASGFLDFRTLVGWHEGSLKRGDERWTLTGSVETNEDEGWVLGQYTVVGSNARGIAMSRLGPFQSALLLTAEFTSDAQRAEVEAAMREISSSAEFDRSKWAERAQNLNLYISRSFGDVKLPRFGGHPNST